MLKHALASLRHRLQTSRRRRQKPGTPALDASTDSTAKDDDEALRAYLGYILERREHRVEIVVISGQDVRAELFLRRVSTGCYYTETPPFEENFQHKMILLDKFIVALFGAEIFQPKLISRRTFDLHPVFAYDEGDQQSFDRMRDIYEQALQLRKELDLPSPWSGAVLALVHEPSDEPVVPPRTGANFARSKGLGFLRASPKANVGCTKRYTESLVKCLLMQRATDRPRYMVIGDDSDTELLRRHLDLMTKQRNIRIDISLYGASGIGKQCLLRRIDSGEYFTGSPPFEEDFQKRVELLDNDIIAVFYRGGSDPTYMDYHMRHHYIALAFNCAKRESIDAMQQAYQQSVAIRRTLGSPAPHSAVVLALACDDVNRADGDTVQLGREFAQEKGLGFMLTSARVGHGCAAESIESLVKYLLLQRLTGSPKFEELRACQGGNVVYDDK